MMAYIDLLGGGNGRSLLGGMSNETRLFLSHAERVLNAGVGLGLEKGTLVCPFGFSA